MAPTITSAMIYSKEHLSLKNKLRKPVVKKLRRYRINNSIEHLKSLLVPEILKQQPDAKLDKADILEITVCFLRRQQQNQPVSSSSCFAAPVNRSYSRCVQEIVHFLSKDEVKTQSQRRLLSHFQSLQPSSDKNRRESDLPQLSSPAQHSISKRSPVLQRPLEALVESYRLELQSDKHNGWTILVQD